MRLAAARPDRSVSDEDSRPGLTMTIVHAYREKGRGAPSWLRTSACLLVLVFATTLLARSGRAELSDAVPEMVPLEGGCFQMGESRIYPEEGPVHTACIEPFAISKTEVTVRQFRAFIEETGYITRAERGWSADEPGGPGIDVGPGGAVFVPPEPGVRSMRPDNWWRLDASASWRRPFGLSSDYHQSAEDPVVQVTREDAEAFALWADGRLPTEAEWEYAARAGTESSLMARPEAERGEARRKANTWQGIFPFVDMADDGYAGIASVARYPANAFGLHDMIGNVWEWTSTPYSPSHAEKDRLGAGLSGYDPAQPGVAVGTIRGGSYLCAPNYCFRFRPAARQAQDLAFGTSHVGFRIVADIRPGEIVESEKCAAC